MSATPPPALARRLVSEAVGTALLLATVVGSGIMGERLAGGNVAIALLANTLATGAGLVALILTFGPDLGRALQSGRHLADAWQGGLPWREVPAYLAAQVVGAFARRRAGAPHVRTAAVLRLAARARGRRPARQRVRGDVRAAVGDLGLRAPSPDGGRRSRSAPTSPPPTGSRVDLVRQSGRDPGARADRHLRGHPSRRCARASSPRSSLGAAAATAALSLARPRAARRRRRVVLPTRGSRRRSS